MVRYLQGEPGQMGRVRAIDRDLKLQRPQVKEVVSEFLPKNRLPLALYEIFPEFFDIKEETTKEKQGEGSAITLKQERPPTIGEKVANWDGISKGEAKVVEEKNRLFLRG